MRSRLGVTGLVAGVFAVAGGVIELYRAQPEGDFDHWAHYALEACFAVFLLAGALGFWLLRRHAESALGRIGAIGAAAGHALIGLSAIITLAAGTNDDARVVAALFPLGALVTLVTTLVLIVESLRGHLDPRWFAPLYLVSILASAPLDGRGGLALWSVAWLVLAARELRGPDRMAVAGV
jgi:uncharacterized membrane protein